LISTEAVLGLPGYQITGIEERAGRITVQARYEGLVQCPECGGDRLRLRDRGLRRLRHESWGVRHVLLELETRKWHCRDCDRSFWQRFPGILPRKRSTEPFRRSVSLKHWDGISRSRLGKREGIGSATVERWFHDFLKLRGGERQRSLCPAVLGIDEHFFSRKQGYATTLCDLKNHSVYDVVLGRSEASLEAYFLSLEGKGFVRVVCMDLASGYRAIVRKHFPR